MSFLAFIGHFFGDLFNAAKRAFDKLAGAEQKAVQDASAIVAVINENLDKAPAELWVIIQKELPGVTEDSVKAALSHVNSVMQGLSSTDGIEAELQALQAYLSKFTGNTWVTITKTVVALVADIFAPGSVIQKIELVLEWVYQEIVKPKYSAAVPAQPATGGGNTDGDNDADDGNAAGGEDGVGNHPVDPPPAP